jgi:hypothetical protein
LSERRVTVVGAATSARRARRNRAARLLRYRIVDIKGLRGKALDINRRAQCSATAERDRLDELRRRSRLRMSSSSP